MQNNLYMKAMSGLVKPNGKLNINGKVYIKDWNKPCPKCNGRGEYFGPTEEMTGCENCNSTGRIIIDV